MKNLFLIIAFFTILCSCNCKSDSGLSYTDEIARRDSCANEVGKRIIIDNDTVTILTYNFHNDYFRLSNNMIISPKAVKKLKSIQN
jgi:hypothetical protein